MSRVPAALFADSEHAEPALRAREAHARLCLHYGVTPGQRRGWQSRDPIEALVATLLSHRTRNRDTGLALRRLQAAYPTWEAARDAPTAALEAAIAPATWPEQKAPRIQAALRQITDERGALNLDFLAALPVAEARAWLERLPGVGPKTSTGTLLWSRLRMAAMPVDCHHHRVAQRLGLIPPRMGPGPAHDALRALLPDDWGPDALSAHHEALMRHGQRCCHHSRPDCRRCPILDLCPTGQRRLKRSGETQRG